MQIAKLANALIMKRVVDGYNFDPDDLPDFLPNINK